MYRHFFCNLLRTAQTRSYPLSNQPHAEQRFTCPYALPRIQSLYSPFPSALIRVHRPFQSLPFLCKTIFQNKPNLPFACNLGRQKQTQSNPIFWLSRVRASRDACLESQPRATPCGRHTRGARACSRSPSARGPAPQPRSRGFVFFRLGRSFYGRLRDSAPWSPLQRASPGA